MKRGISLFLIALLMLSACSTGNWADLPDTTDSLGESLILSGFPPTDTAELESSTDESDPSEASESDPTTTEHKVSASVRASTSSLVSEDTETNPSDEGATPSPTPTEVDPTSVEPAATTASQTTSPATTVAATTSSAAKPTELTPTPPSSAAAPTAAATTTKPPTTKPPTTTAAPATTAPPTTVAATTVAPSTTAATTVPPTTVAPTTVAPQAPSTFTPYVKNNILIMSDRATDLFGSTAGLQTDYAQLVNRVASLIPSARVFNLVAPTSVEFYAPANYISGSASQRASITAIYNQLSNVTSVDAYSSLQAHKNEYIYLRTDHHWTGLGAYYAYTAFAQRAGFGALPLSSFTAGRIPNSFLGTFYSWSGKVQSLVPLADTINYWYPPFTVRGWSFADASMSGGREIQLIRTNYSGANHYLAFTDGDHKLARFDSSIGNGKSILVIKESYGNAMIPYLAAHYQHVYVLDPRLIQPNLKSLVEANGIQTILIINYNAIIGNPTWKNGMRATLS